MHPPARRAAAAHSIALHRRRRAPARGRAVLAECPVPCVSADRVRAPRVSPFRLPRLRVRLPRESETPDGPAREPRVPCRVCP